MGSPALCRTRSAITVIGLAVVLSAIFAGPAFGRTAATRLTTASAATKGALAVGAFAQPDGSFLVSGWTDSFFTTAQSGFSVARAGGTFPGRPVRSPPTPRLPGGSSLIGTNGNIQLRAADGSLSGAARSVAATGLGVDSSGNATAAGVVSNGSYQIIVSTRPPARPSPPPRCP
ncbi:MAG: hypothetical protein M3071_15975 [Actinomycetota bacterium]|nr:hypothetical protein [Actinomycetota bacterium]